MLKRKVQMREARIQRLFYLEQMSFWDVVNAKLAKRQQKCVCGCDTCTILKTKIFPNRKCQMHLAILRRFDVKCVPDFAREKTLTSTGVLMWHRRMMDRFGDSADACHLSGIWTDGGSRLSKRSTVRVIVSSVRPLFVYDIIISTYSSVLFLTKIFSYKN